MQIQLVDNGSGKVVMQFCNCSLTLPSSTGFYVVSSGCGSGKTTIIKGIIKKYCNMGVLVIVATIEAAEELRQKLPPFAKCCILHSDPRATSEMDNYRKDPTFLEKYDVVVVTSARIQIDPYILFLSYKQGYRKFVLIDEMINYYVLPFELPKELLNVVTFVDRHKSHKGNKGENLGNGWYRHIYQDKDAMTAAYGKSGVKLFNATNGLTEYKLNYIFEHIIRNGFKPIHNKIKNYLSQSTTILFDGTADCLISDKDPRLLPVSGYQYESDIEFVPFEMPLRRKNSEGWNVDVLKTIAKPVLDLIKTICQINSLLIITWMTIDVVKKNNGNADDFEAESKVSHNFPELLTKCLKDVGVSEDRFKVIYRGSGQDRGSNEYRDFQSVMFLGEWRIPDDIVGNINNMFAFHCDYEGYMKSLLIQTICRIQIRKHQGLPIKVYYSSDMNMSRLYDVQEYFRAKSDVKCKIWGVKKPKKPISRPDKKALLDMIALYSYDPKIRTAIESESKYQFTITLDKLFSILPRSRKAKERYNNLINYLKTRNITMTIV